jgi:chromosome partitioning protein
VRASEISVEGVSIYAHDPSGKVALEYEEFTREVMNSEEK